MDRSLSISYIKLKIKMRAEEKTELPAWTGSTIRGAFGNELLATCCTSEKSGYLCCECTEKCSGGLLFAAGTSEQNESKISPYVISANENNFDGEVVEFGITLFAEGTQAADDVMKVIENGLRLGAGRTRFVTESVTDAVNEAELYDGKVMLKPEVHILNPEREKAGKLYVEYVTPYKTRVSASGFGFEQLVRAMLRRTSTLLRQLGTDPDFDYQRLLQMASEVSIRYKDISFSRTQRYSNRTGSKMEVAGFTGMMVFEGDITPFMPLFRITEVIHAGKMCVMGLGEIKVSVLE